MSIIIWVIVGAISGWIASKITSEDSSMGLGANIVVGMLGSLIGGFVVTLLTTGNGDFSRAFTSFDFTSILVSIVGAVIVIGLVKLFKRA